MLCGVGCSQLGSEYPSEKGSLSVVLNATATTRATTPGDGNIYDGGGMEDVTLILVNSMGNISEIQQISSLSGEEQRAKSVTFVNLDVGNYTLYAYANVERSLLDEVKSMLSTLRVGDAFDSNLYDALFTSLANRETPIIDDTHPLLLTASKAISVGIENSSTTIDLLRPVVKFEVRLYNHSTYPMQIDDVSFSNFNPSTGYILPKNGQIPSSVTYRGLPLYDTYTGGTDVTVAAMSEGQIYQTALFENRAPSYTMSLTIKGGNDELVTATGISTTGTYALKNRSTGRYLADNGSGRLVVVSSLDAAVSREHALWKFSGTSSGYITNVATGNRYYRGTSAATSGSNLTFSISSSGYLRIYYSSNRYLRDNSGTVSFSNTSNTTREWSLQQTSQRTATISNKQINVVDMHTAAVTPMTEQLRNQHIKIVINAYYNETDGVFNFAVTPWKEKNEDVSFN